MDAENESFELKPRSPSPLSAQAVRKPCTPTAGPSEGQFGLLWEAWVWASRFYRVVPPVVAPWAELRFRCWASEPSPPLASNPRSPVHKRRNPAPKPRSPNPKPRSPGAKPRSPGPKPRSPASNPRNSAPESSEPNPHGLKKQVLGTILAKLHRKSLLRLLFQLILKTC